MTTTFDYEAFMPDGHRRRRGSVQANNIDEANELIRSSRGLIPIKVRVRSPYSVAVLKERFQGSHISSSELAWMARALATSVSIGIPMDRAVSALSRQRAGTGIGRILENIQEALYAGKSNALAFEEQEKILGELCTVMVAQGDDSGKLDETLTKLAEILEARARIVQAIRSAMVYPIMTLLIVVILTTVMMLVAVPIFKKLYISITAHAKLPVPTQIVVAISDTIICHWYIVIPAVFGLIYGIYRAFKSPTFRQAFDKYLLHAPVFGDMMSNASSARMAYTLASLMNSGMVSQKALRYSGDVAGNFALKEAMYQAADQVERGISVTTALAVHDDVVPEMFLLCVQQGEETAQMPDLLDRFGKQAEEAAATKAQNMSQILEPLLTVVLGGIVGTIVIALYLPMFDVFKLLQHQSAT